MDQIGMEDEIYRVKNRAAAAWEGVANNRVSSTTTMTTSSSAHHLIKSMRKDSHPISKAGGKPKIRIIHIFAPEIIKTDVANFRELVQRLTGKPPPPNHHRHQEHITSFCNKKKKPATASASIRSNNILASSNNSSSSSNSRRSSDDQPAAELIGYCDNYNKQMEMRRPAPGCDKNMSSGEGSSGGGGGFLSGFADTDGYGLFMQELGSFPVVLPNPPLMDVSSSNPHLHHPPHVVFGESQFA